MALTHKSASKQNNERLEFTGDAVLGYVIATLLYRRYPTAQEDSLTLMRAYLVRGTMLAEVAREIDLGRYLQMGEGERKSGGRARNSILANAFEALLGAVHEDAGKHGVDAVWRVIEDLFSERIDRIEPENLKDPKTRLQELLQGRGHALPDYTVAATAGADHAREYTVTCRIADLDLITEATASSRRSAEKAAAKVALQQLLDAEIGT